MLAFRIVTVITTHDIYEDDEAEEENHVILHIVKTSDANWRQKKSVKYFESS